MRASANSTMRCAGLFGTRTMRETAPNVNVSSCSTASSLACGGKPLTNTHALASTPAGAPEAPPDAERSDDRREPADGTPSVLVCSRIGAADGAPNRDCGCWDADDDGAGAGACWCSGWWRRLWCAASLSLSLSLVASARRTSRRRPSNMSPSATSAERACDGETNVTTTTPCLLLAVSIDSI